MLKLIKYIIVSAFVLTVVAFIIREITYLSYYNTAVTTNTIEGWQEYMQKVPERNYKNADNKILELKENQLWGTEKSAWKTARTQNTLVSYKKYLNLYKDGTNSKTAKRLVSEITEANAYNKAMSGTLADCRSFLSTYSESPKISRVLEREEKLTEQQMYKDATSSNASIKQCEEYLNKYPSNGSKASNVKRNLYQIKEKTHYNRAINGTIADCRSYLNSYTNSSNAVEIRIRYNDLLEQSEYNKYINNRLANGATPYRAWYGSNLRYDRSKIRMTAPDNSDMIAIVKRNNNNGIVIGHAYIRKGNTFVIEVPNGTYQCFFYFGKGWHPKKLMSKGIKGGFISEESYSKADPETLNFNILTYIMQNVRDGNFTPDPSNANEIF